MSGPPYPHPNPVSGSNAIGEFIIGVSPIGTIAPFDFWATILSQYANSPILTGMISRFNAAMDQTENMDNFYDMIWNVLTAVGYGLDVWGRIVGVERTVPIPNDATFLGFDEAGGWTGFGQGGFFSGTSIASNFVLSDANYRVLILAKAATNISDGSIPSMNAILMRIFTGRGDVYVVDNMDMSIDLHFSFTLNPLELAIVELSGVLPNPCGVVINIVQP